MSGSNDRSSDRFAYNSWQYVYLGSLLALLTTISFFAVAVALLPKDPSPKPPKPMEDITFLLLLSSTIYMILNNCLEIEKLILHKSKEDYWKKHILPHILPLFLLFVAVALAIAAPAVYGSGDEKNRWWSVNPVILNFAANILSVLANVLGVLMAGREKYKDRRRVWDVIPCL